MYSFLVLGLIPGTNIQIGFWAWVVITIGCYIAFRHYKQRIINHVSVWWHQFDDDDMIRKPLHANQLHLRGL